MGAVRSLIGVVNFLRRHRSARAFLAVLMLLGWFAATNHCALGLMQKSAPGKVEHSKCCSGKATPAKDGQQPDGARECCKSIQAAPLPDGKVLAKCDTLHFAVQVFALLTGLGDEAAALVALCDHGPPPRAASFSELVLHRSLRAHAPPSLA